MVLIRYFAAARSATGVASETIDESVGARNLDDVLTLAVRRHGPDLARVLVGCSFLVDGISVRDRGTVLEPDCTLDVLPPFAGG